MVALIGRPNVGKSTLMNRLIEDQISIITPMAQTTRNQIRGIQNHEKGQIVYLDTPGVHHAHKALNRYMVEQAVRAMEGVDVVFYLVDASRPDLAVLDPDKKHKKDPPGLNEDLLVLKRLKNAECPVFLVVNKVDRIRHKADLLPLIEKYSEHFDFAEVFPISATLGDGLDALQDETFARMPESPPLFPPEYSTDQVERAIVGEMIRKQIILSTRDEIPHSTAVTVESFDESERGEEIGEGIIRIEAAIYVERDSQKGIIIGKKGSQLKLIGTESRKEIEDLLGCKVFLKLWVGVAKNWSKDPKGIQRFGYR